MLPVDLNQEELEAVIAYLHKFAVSRPCEEDLRLLRRRNTDENLIPLMMFARRTFSISSKTAIEYFAVMYLKHVHQTPSRQAAVALPSDLKTEQPDDSVLDAVIMRLYYPLLILVHEPEQMLLCDGFSK